LNSLFEMTDSELITALIDRNEEAFRILVSNYQDMVMKACYHLLQDTQDAEDIAQDVFVEAFLSISGFRGESKLSTWLYRIAINKSKNLLRKNKWQSLVQRLERFIPGEKHPYSDIEDTSATHAMLDMERSQEQQILWQAINNLPENQRLAFSLNKYEELSYQEIAEILQTTLSSVESLIHRAKINLQKKLVYHFEKSL
jgi:RNA polymerase sigma-70 factor, ECF subfamily